MSSNITPGPVQTPTAVDGSTVSTAEAAQPPLPLPPSAATTGTTHPVSSSSESPLPMSAAADDTSCSRSRHADHAQRQRFLESHCQLSGLSAQYTAWMLADDGSSTESDPMESMLVPRELEHLHPLYEAPVAADGGCLNMSPPPGVAVSSSSTGFGRTRPTVSPEDLVSSCSHAGAGVVAAPIASHDTQAPPSTSLAVHPSAHGGNVGPGVGTYTLWDFMTNVLHSQLSVFLEYPDMLPQDIPDGGWDAWVRAEKFVTFCLVRLRVVSRGTRHAFDDDIRVLRLPRQLLCDMDPTRSTYCGDAFKFFRRVVVKCRNLRALRLHFGTDLDSWNIPVAMGGVDAAWMVHPTDGQSEPPDDSFLPSSSSTSPRRYLRTLRSLTHAPPRLGEPGAVWGDAQSEYVCRGRHYVSMGRTLAECCPRLEHVELIDFHDDRFTLHSIESLIRGCSCLRVLYLDLIPHLDDDVMFLLGQHCPRLSSCHAAFTSVSDRGVEALAKSCPKLESVAFDSCRVGDSGFQALVYYCPTLRRIRFSNTLVTPALFGTLQSGPRLLSCLEVLNLSHCVNFPAAPGLDALVSFASDPGPFSALTDFYFMGRGERLTNDFDGGPEYTEDLAMLRFVGQCCPKLQLLQVTHYQGPQHYGVFDVRELRAVLRDVKVLHASPLPRARVPGDHPGTDYHFALQPCGMKRSHPPPRGSSDEDGSSDTDGNRQHPIQRFAPPMVSTAPALPPRTATPTAPMSVVATVTPAAANDQVRSMGPALTTREADLSGCSDSLCLSYNWPLEHLVVNRVTVNSQGHTKLRQPGLRLKVVRTPHGVLQGPVVVFVKPNGPCDGYDLHGARPPLTADLPRIPSRLSLQLVISVPSRLRAIPRQRSMAWTRV